MINLSVPARIVASRLQCSINYYFVLFLQQELSTVFLPTINFVLFPPTLIAGVPGEKP